MDTTVIRVLMGNVLNWREKFKCVRGEMDLTAEDAEEKQIMNFKF